MSGDLKHSPFYLIPGGSTVTGPARAPRLEVVPHREVPAVQLGFPFVRVSHKMLVSFGYEGLSQRRLETLLSDYMPAMFADIRVSPSFNSHELSRASVSKALKAFQVKYIHLPELANRFVGDSLDFRLSLERYASSLANNPHLSELRAMIEQGPVLLLSSASAHEHSERSVLVDELQRRWPDFDVVVHT